MSKDDGTKGKIEVERCEVAKEDIVVHGAQITCDYAGKGKVPNYLSILDGHGIMEAGKHCAHDAACVPIKNIQPFASCKNPNAGKVLSELIINATSDAKARYNEALNVYNGNTQNRTGKPIPCALPLLDRWFDATEKDKVTICLDMDSKALGLILSLEGNMPASLNWGIDRVRSSLASSTHSNDEKSSEEQTKLENKIKDLESIKTRIVTLCKEARKEIEKSTQIAGNDFKYLLSELRYAKNSMDKIGSSWDEAYSIYSELIKYQEYKDDLEKSIEDIEAMISKIEDWEEEEYHLITTESFLVCRCGGIISIDDSGQDYGATVDKLTTSILTMITEIKLQCQRRMEGYGIKESDNESLEEWDDFAQEWGSYKAVAEELEYMENMLSVLDKSDPETASIYIELTCRSFNDERNKRIMSMLSLISLRSGSLSILLALFAILNPEEDAQGVADSAAAYFDLMEPILENAGGLGTAGKVIAKTNSLNTILSSLSNLFYVSYDTAVENIRITIFTNRHAMVWERAIEESGELGKLLRAGNLETQKNYSAGLKKGDLKWKEDPGVHMETVMHFGVERDGGAEVEDKDGIEKNMHFFNKN